ncbi:MAG: hypothetical protein C5B57_09435 [Blastocatellia bacterium]|nr:MAG: hypothetical protein C5B57_09435 [Blastocatellia bacterium]
MSSQGVDPRITLHLTASQRNALLDLIAGALPSHREDQHSRDDNDQTRENPAASNELLQLVMDAEPSRESSYAPATHSIVRGYFALGERERERLRNELPGELSFYHVPPVLQNGIIRYLVDGVLPEGFLQAVLCNNLVQSCRQADSAHIYHLRDVVDCLTACAPPESWGSRERVLAWTSTPERFEY